MAGIVERAMAAIWSALLKNKKSVLMSKLTSDPEFQKTIEKLDASKKELETRLEKMRKFDPGFAEWEKKHSDIFDVS